MLNLILSMHGQEPVSLSRGFWCTRAYHQKTHNSASDSYHACFASAVALPCNSRTTFPQTWTHTILFLTAKPSRSSHAAPQESSRCSITSALHALKAVCKLTSCVRPSFCSIYTNLPAQHHKPQNTTKKDMHTHAHTHTQTHTHAHTHKET